MPSPMLSMLQQDPPRFRSCEPSGAPPGWCLRCVARCQGLSGQTFDRPRHAYTSIEYVEEGFGSLTIGGQTRRLGPGDAFILPEGEAHRIVCDDVHPWRILFLNCTGPLPRQLLSAYGLEEVRIFPRTMIAQPMRNLLHFSGDDADLQVRAGQAIHETIAMLHGGLRKIPDWPDLVIRTKVFIDANLEHQIRLPDVARHAGCSEAHLSRSFRRCLGMPPGDYILTQRMALAQSLLSSTGDPVKAIAARLGYRDAFSFSHAFKNLVGEAPTLWRSRRIRPADSAPANARNTGACSAHRTLAEPVAAAG